MAADHRRSWLMPAGALSLARPVTFVLWTVATGCSSTPNPASVEAQTVVSGSRRGSADMARRSPSGRRPLGSAQVMHQLVPQRSTQLRRRAHAVHPRGGAARPETPVSCNSLTPLRSCPPRPKTRGSPAANASSTFGRRRGLTSLRSHHGGRRAQTGPGSSTDATKTREPSRSWRRTAIVPGTTRPRGQIRRLDTRPDHRRYAHTARHRQSSGGLHQHRQNPLIMPDPRASCRGGFAFLPWRQIDGSSRGCHQSANHALRSGAGRASDA
jgi:hypothetical protein